MSDRLTSPTGHRIPDATTNLAQIIDRWLGEIDAQPGSPDQLTSILQELVDFVGGEMGLLALVRPDTGGLAPSISVSQPADGQPQELLHSIEKLANQVMQDGQARFVADYPSWADTVATGALPASVMIVPVQISGRLEGVLAVTGSRQSTDFTESDLQVVSLFARLAAIVSQAEQRRDELERLTTTDSLTGVWTRSAFFERAEFAFRQAVRYRRPLSAILIDIDRFKMLNEMHGYAVGDQVLGTVARNIVSRLRDSDLLGRYGGEEFILLLPETDLEHARMAAERMRSQIAAAPTDTPRGTFFVTISAGVASLESAEIDQLDRLLDLADRAARAAKLAGRNQVAVFVQEPEA